MMMIARSTEYDDILDAVRGRKVAVWACNTCAKLCNGIGGQDAAGRLAGRLEDDGVEVTSVSSTSAACLMQKVMPKADEVSGNADVIISLTCDIGVVCAARAFEKDVLAPFITLGFGYLDGDGVPMMISGDGVSSPMPLEDLAKEKGMAVRPLV
ncbi:MAG: hypothetical protein LBV13_04930 [Methanomassiliicoccaceae archaeon]|jgi:hypothetical protein|nr:hypothetical protein [Methanomassiliicoccaceae archaeon]